MIAWWTALAWAAPDRSAPPLVADPGLLAHPEPTVMLLRPGVVAWHVLVPEARKSTVQIVWGRGGADAEAPLELTRALGALAYAAGGRFDAAELADWRDRSDVALWSSVGQHETEVGFTAPPEALGEAFARAAAIVHEPSFPRPELARWAVDQELFLTSTGPASATTLARLVLAYGWFPADHPYGRRPDLPTLGTIRRRDLRRTWTSWTTDAPLTVLAVGGPWALFEPHLTELVAEMGRDVSRSAAHPFTARTMERWVAVDLAPSSEGPASATISCQLAAPPLGHGDGSAMRIANMVLGGTFNARLNRNLREAKGLTYGIDSVYRRDTTWGTVTIEVSVPATSVAETIAEIEGELRGLASDPPSADELLAAKRALAADWNRAFETAPRAAALYRRALYEGRAIEVLRAELDSLLALDSADVANVAGRWFGDQRAPMWVVVGPRADVEGELHSIGKVAEWVAPAPAILGRF